MVLFTSDRPLERAENIRTVYEAFDASKRFVRTSSWRQKISDAKYTVRVSDEFIGYSQCKTVMIGHAISGGKFYGLDQRRPYYGRRHAGFLHYVVTSSEAMRGLVAHQSGIPIDRVLALGTPRTDAYFGVKKGDGGTFLKEKRAYLYAPTFRNVGEVPFPEINWPLIDGLLTDGEVLVVKPHMNMGRILKEEYSHIVEVSSSVPSTPYLIDCDVLITDYSSIMLDAHILGRPVVLFEKKRGYVEDRGMYLDYPGGYASRYCTNEADLVEISRGANGQNEADILCRDLTAGACDGHSTERVVKLIRDIE